MEDVYHWDKGEFDASKSHVGAFLTILICREDCTLIPNTRNVACESTQCVVYSCKDGFKVNPSGNACLAV